MDRVFSVQLTSKRMELEYVCYDADYWLVIWIEREYENNGIVFREWNERMKRLEGLIPPIKRILTNVIMNEKEYNGIVS